MFAGVFYYSLVAWLFMTQFFQVHPTHPQQRLIVQAVDILRQGGVIAYPTDCAYAFGCCIGNKKALYLFILNSLHAVYIVFFVFALRLVTGTAWSQEQWNGLRQKGLNH